MISYYARAGMNGDEIHIESTVLPQAQHSFVSVHVHVSMYTQPLFATPSTAPVASTNLVMFVVVLEQRRNERQNDREPEEVYQQE